MTERPILFSAPMVRAILEGRKTQTRPIIKPQPRGWNQEQGNGNLWLWCVAGDMDYSEEIACPYGRPGDMLWVRESGWERPERSPRMLREGADTWPPYIYSADDHDAEQLRAWGWRRRPSIHMPRWASRITLRLTAVRAQRLQDIDDADARAEGVTFPSREATFYEGKWVADYADVWDRVNKRRSGCAWADNPWVWALTFEVVAPAGVGRPPE